MRASVLLAAVASFGASLVASVSSPTIGSPTLYQCTAAAFVYTCYTDTCTVVVRPSDDATSSIASLGSVSGNGSVSWTVDVASGTSVTAYITDTDGTVGNNAATTVADGTTDCTLSTTAGSSSTSTGTKASSSSSGTAAATGSTTSTSTSSAASSSSSSDTSGASGLVAGGFIASALAISTLLL